MTASRPWAGTLYLAVGRALYVGVARDTKPHAHHAIQACFSLKEPFRLRESPSARWTDLDAAIIPTNVPHQLDGRGHPLAILYLEPESERGRTVVECRSSTETLSDELLSQVRQVVREAASKGSTAVITPALFDAVFRSLALAPLRHNPLDPRIARILKQLRSDANRYGSIPDLAASEGLSTRRLRELFRSEVGISCQRTLLWTRLSLAIGELTQGRSITDAAHGVGFSDAAHLTRTFHRMFGIPPTTLREFVRLGSVLDI